MKPLEILARDLSFAQLVSDVRREIDRQELDDEAITIRLIDAVKRHDARVEKICRLVDES